LGYFRKKLAVIFLKKVAQILTTLWAGVVAQLVGWSLLTPEICGSNLVIGKIYNQCLLLTVFKRREEKNRGREWPI